MISGVALFSGKPDGQSAVDYLSGAIQGGEA